MIIYCAFYKTISFMKMEVQKGLNEIYIGLYCKDRFCYLLEQNYSSL